ncbi:MAG: SprT-like domain-containing protein [Flavobacteriales bacterium]|nr:SprT-like domain-containing protein [Flavobacteriales bacterium]MBK7553269.1 SprT-like domain-containing protein [Flavobacteriales bacterium]MBK9194886.1 SprT-like domain-containing protein [Flavobacteriales bacterium]MBP6573810.1 SprT-like domain-containing protein [Flavobacteriales bacterium]
MLAAHTNASEALCRRLPAAAVPVVINFLRRNPVQVRVSKPRITKLGDYRNAYGTQPHRISVNANLNKYAFLVTLVHEFAHYTTFVRTRRMTNPHGKAWKDDYAQLMRPFMSRDVFPADILHALEHHLHDAPASSCTDHNLLRILRRYDPDPVLFVEELQERSIFRLNGKLFVKGTRLRTRFKCRCLNDRRTYHIDAVAEVQVDRPVQARKAG